MEKCWNLRTRMSWVSSPSATLLLCALSIDTSKEKVIDQKTVLKLVPFWILFYGTNMNLFGVVRLEGKGKEGDADGEGRERRKTEIVRFLNEFSSFLTTHTPVHPLRTPSIWSPIAIPKQPRPVELLPTQQDRAHWNLFFFLHFNSRLARPH